MATCKKIRRVDKRVCIGSLNKKIGLYERSIGVPVLANVDFNEGFELIKTVWSMVNTVGNRVFFDGTNTDRVYTHDFFIRVIKDIAITSEIWIKYNEEYHNILSTENLNEENKFIWIKANVRGTVTKPVNYN